MATEKLKDVFLLCLVWAGFSSHEKKVNFQLFLVSPGSEYSPQKHPC